MDSPVHAKTTAQSRSVKPWERRHQLERHYGALQPIFAVPATIITESAIHERLRAYRAPSPLAGADGATEWFWAHPMVMGLTLALRQFDEFEG